MRPSSSPTSAHVWNFVRVGGLDQVVIATTDDLVHLPELDQKLWVALSCPVTGTYLDEKTLALIDRDHDGRIRVPELLDAIRWATLHLQDVGTLLVGNDRLPLAEINDQTDDGRRTLASAKAILHGLGQSEADAVTLAQASDTVKLFASTPFNGDGVINVNATDDPVIAAVIADIILTSGGKPERGGGTGLDQSQADKFFAACTERIDWLNQGQTPDILTLGEATPSAYTALKAVRAKVDDYFARARLAAYDPRALPALNHSEGEYFKLVAQDLAITADELATFPLVQIEPGRPLPLLADTLNPAWAAALTTLHRDAVTPLFGPDKTHLTLTEWQELTTRLKPYAVWLESKSGDTIARLTPERIQAILAADTQGPINALLARDKALEPEFNAIHGVERLIRYRRDFPVLLRNFVNFLDFYNPDTRAVFQAGRLYLDSRSTDLCIQVAGPSPLAAMSKAYIAYCDCSRPGRPPIKIAACFTQGDSDYLFVGRNGIFYDRQGLDWDARITAVVDNPISVRQAFLSPYKKFVRLIEEQVAKRAAAAEAEADKKLTVAATSAVSVAASSAKSSNASDKKVDVGTVAAIGVAFGALGTFATAAIGYATGIVAGGPLIVAAALLGVILVISGPSMIIAWIKLRQRTLGPILDANGWAINSRVKISVPFGTRLTARARIPSGAHRTLKDPYEPPATARRVILLLGLTLILAAAAIRVHATHFNAGRYFWQPAPIAAPAP